jgi:hypothetical protein
LNLPEVETVISTLGPSESVLSVLLFFLYVHKLILLA